MTDNQFIALASLFKLLKVSSTSESMLKKYKRACDNLGMTFDQEKALSIIFDLGHYY